MFNNLVAAGDDVKVNEDKVFKGYKALESDAYLMTIKMVYGMESAGGAMAIVIQAETEDGNSFQETLWVSNKKKETFFTNDKGEKVLLPGFQQANELCLVTTNKPLTALESTERVLEVYDSKAKGKVKKPMPVLLDLIGKKVILGILKQVEFKQEKIGDEWVDTDQTRETNTLSAVFHAEKKITVNEAKAKVSEPSFYNEWLETYKGQTVDRTKGKGGNKPKPAAKGGFFSEGSASGGTSTGMFG